MPVTVCPNCNAAMTEISRRGVFVDVCPACRGVWLDGGELEKLLATADAGAAAAPQEPRYRSRDDYRDAHRDDPYYRRDDRRDDRRADRRDDPRDDRRDDRWDERPRRRSRDGGVFELFSDLFD